MLRTKVLSDKGSALLTNQQCRRVCVCAKVVRADAQVDTLQIRSAVDIETFIDNTTLFSWLHGTSTE